MKMYIVTTHRIESNEWEFAVADNPDTAVEMATQILKEYYQDITPQDGTHGMIEDVSVLRSYLGENMGLLDVQIHEKTLNKQ